MKIVVLDGYTENPGDLSWDGLGALGELTVYDRTPVASEERIISAVGDAEIVVTNKTPVSKTVLDACPNVRMIAVLATGYNVVDVGEARRRGIPVCNVPAYGTRTVSQYAVGMLLEICAHYAHHDATVKAGRWTASEDFCYWDYPMIELAGKIAGIIGLGRIGKATAGILKALGMKVIAYDAVQTEEGAACAAYVTLSDLFHRSDVIFLHCPLFVETKHIIRAENIAKMKDGVILVNNSRGPLIHEQDLADALNSGKIYAAALDVVSEEPIRADNPLLRAKNCMITPHISWAAKEARMRIMETTEANIRGFLNGQVLNCVNP